MELGFTKAKERASLMMNCFDKFWFQFHNRVIIVAFE